VGDVVLNTAYYDLMGEYAPVQRLHRKLSSLQASAGVEWIVQRGTTRKGHPYVEVKPLWAGTFAKSFYFDKAFCVLLMSATPPRLQDLGIGDALRVTIPSTFPVERRPFVLDFVGNMSRAHYDETLPKVLSYAEETVRERATKGIIHAVSFRTASAIVDYLRSVLDVPVFEHIKETTREDALQAFRDSPAPAVLVSPSFETGLDLPYDGVRWQLLAKVPFPSLGDRVTKRRAQVDPEWYLAKTAQRLVQAYGRGMRAEDDAATTIMIDSAYRSFYRRAKRLLPAWFLEAHVEAPSAGRLPAQ
jgi:Rad3-related DNA helicase